MVNKNILKKDLVNLTSKLISYKTIIGNKKEINRCFSFIKRYMNGFFIKEFVFNGVKSLVISKTNKKHFDTILLGHVDVVPVQNNQFKPKVKGNRLYGSGVGDMKGGVAIAMVIMKKIIPDNTGLIITSDEEVGGGNGAEKIAKIYDANFVIALEPTDEYIAIRKKGVIWIEMKSQGVAGHSTALWEAKNAAVNLINAYLEIKKLFPDATKKSSNIEKWKRTCNLAMLKAGGESFNVVPDFAKLGLDIRYPEYDNPKEIIRKIKEIAKKYSCKVNASYVHSVNTNPNNKYVQLLKKIGKLSFYKGAYGSSDIRAFARKGIPAIDFGPEEDNIHHNSECIYIDSMMRVYNILEKFLNQKAL